MMIDYIVSEVIDGDTFKVVPNWVWGEEEGDTIRPAGYDTPEKGESGYEEAKEKLEGLILNERVKVDKPQTIDNWHQRSEQTAIIF